MVTKDDETATLAEKLHALLDDFIARNAPRIRDEVDQAVFRVTIFQPQGDDDGILYLDSRVEEEVTVSEVGGRVPGVVWDPAVVMAAHHSACVASRVVGAACSCHVGRGSR